MQNKRVQTERRFTVTDWLLVLAILACMAGIGVRAWKENRPKEMDGTVRVTALWEDVDRRTVACLTEGEILYTEQGAQFGTVIAVRSIPAVRSVQGADGDPVKGAVEGDPRCHAEVVLEVAAEKADGLWRRRNGQPLTLGASYVLYGARTRSVLRLTALP